jgi:hypothetical protein
MLKRSINVLAVTVLMAILMVTLVSPAFAVPATYEYRDCNSQRDWYVYENKGCKIWGYAEGQEDGPPGQEDRR